MSGHVRKLESGKWIGRFPLGERGKFRSKSFDRKTDAQRWLRDQNAAKDTGQWVDPTEGKTLFSNVAAAWIENRRVAESTLARDRSYLRNHVLTRWGDRQLDSITPADVEQWVKELSRQFAPATVHKVVQIFSAIMGRAVTRRLISANPVQVVNNLPRIQEDEMRFLTPEQVHALADLCGDYGGLVICAAYTGMRWAEIIGLEWSAVDVDRRQLVVVSTVVEVDGNLIRKPPKTRASKRTIALPQTVLDWLPEKVPGQSLVFADSNGGPLRRSNFRKRVWYPATQELGLDGTRFHDLRHTHASWLIANGEHPKVIQSRLGHSSIRITLDRYGHLMTGLDEDAAGRLDALIS